MCKKGNIHMRIVQDTFPILENEHIAEDTYSLVFHAPHIAQRARAGQFVNVRCADKTLRRPISICEIDKEAGNLRLVYGVRGEGTAWLSQLTSADTVDVLGPLGNGFNFLSAFKKAVFVGGGIGVPPLLEASKKFGQDAVAIIGFRNKDFVILEKDFESVVSKTIVTTDDGSYGINGFVSTPLEEELKKGEHDVIYACGPMRMLKSIADLAKQYNVPCYVSLEERMGCGMGACLGCACKIKRKGKEQYLHVCKEGPIFLAEEVVFGG